MNVTYNDKAKRGEEDNLLQRATSRLEEVLGPSAGLVTAEWERGQDERGRILYTLKLSDQSGDVSTTFSADELRSPSKVRSRLLELWGDLLQMRSDAQVRKIQQLVTQGE
jgi:hypothetical protein